MHLERQPPERLVASEVLIGAPEHRRRTATSKASSCRRVGGRAGIHPRPIGSEDMRQEDLRGRPGLSIAWRSSSSAARRTSWVDRNASLLLLGPLLARELIRALGREQRVRERIQVAGQPAVVPPSC